MQFPKITVFLGMPKVSQSLCGFFLGFLVKIIFRCTLSPGKIWLIIIMFALTPKDKQYKGVTPQLSHCFWRERVSKENESKAVRYRTTDGDLSLVRNFKYSSVSPGKGRDVFSKEVVNLFTDFVNTKAKFDFSIDFPRKVKAVTAVNWTRLNNGGHIPRIQGSDKTGYYGMFAKKSYIKPHQLPQDSSELNNIIDDIKTNPRHTYSKKQELIELALKYK